MCLKKILFLLTSSVQMLGGGGGNGGGGGSKGARKQRSGGGEGVRGLKSREWLGRGGECRCEKGEGGRKVDAGGIKGA